MMSGFLALRLLIVTLTLCEIGAIPIVLKETTPNGQSVIAISSSDPKVEKYLMEYAAEHAKRDQHPTAANPNSQNHGTVVQSFSIATPENTITGTGRSFGDPASGNPFFTPFFYTPNFDAFDFSSWFRNIERLYDPSVTGNGASVTATAVNDNGRIYGKVETVNSNNKEH